MQDRFKNYKNNAIVVTQDNVYEQVAFLFERTAVLLAQAQEEQARKEYEAYSNTMQKSINILAGLAGILNPNDTNFKECSEASTRQPSPWDEYFIAVFITFNEIAVSYDKTKADMLITSLKNIASLWKQADGNKTIRSHPETMASNPGELTLSC